MSDYATNLDSAVARKLAIAIGVVLLLVGVLFFIAGVAGVVSFFAKNPGRSVLVIAIISTVSGAYCIAVAIRMVFGLKRIDGGLLSPGVLRSAGILFLILPVILFIDSDRSNWKSLRSLLELGFSWSVSAGCFALASRRQHPVLGQDRLPNDT